ncbi:MAG: transporter permease [Eubacterium sp.]|nr:transporter permease [Eubacterium sp.]
MNIRKKQSQNITLVLFVLPAFIFFAAFKLIPAILGLWFSFTNWNGINPSYKIIGLENFIEIFTSDTDFWKSMLFTLKYVLFAIIALNICALMLAVLIESIRKGKSFFRTIFYMPNMISMIIGGYMWSFIFTQVLYYIADNAGWEFLNKSWLGDPKYSFIAIIIVAVWGGAGYLMVIYIAAIQSVPTTLMEAAVVDGASAFRRFISITLPMIKQAFTICLFVTLNGAFQVFDVVFSLTGGGPGRLTQVVAINIYEEAFGRSNRLGYATAKSTILFLVIMLITLIQLQVMKKREEEM